MMEPIEVPDFIPDDMPGNVADHLREQIEEEVQGMIALLLTEGWTVAEATAKVHSEVRRIIEEVQR